MKQKINSILKEVLEKIEPPKEDLKIIENSIKDFKEKVEKEIKSLKIIAEVFIGGSFAKNTVIKKDSYDVDAFVRFDKKYGDEEISKLTKKILKKFTNVSIIHGSRDYFRIKISPSFFIEVIPVIKIKNPKEARNITDLSYSHVKYIKNKIKKKNLSHQIKLAKIFCYANNCYGAESYINGFSGYSLELLICKYGWFLKFIKEIIKLEEKEIIDIEKLYKNKQQILMDMNGAKLKSPIVLIDPTYKQRNALAALSEETLEKFKKICREFIENPSIKDFEIKKIDLKKIKEESKKRKKEFSLIEAHTEKQEGDVAGSKLLKFYNHLEKEISIFFKITNKGFNYNGEKSARYFFVAKSKKDILFDGPSIKDKKNFEKFKNKHNKIFQRKGRAYSIKKINFDLNSFIEKWKKKNKRKLKEMSINELKLIEL